MSEERTVLWPSDVVPRLVAVVAQNVIDGMRVWGAVVGDEIRLSQYPCLVDRCARASASQPRRIRVEVISPVEGPVYLAYDPDQLVMVEAQSRA